MGRFETEIAKAKEEIQSQCTTPVTNWFVVEGEKGYVVADADHIAKLSQRKFNKLMKLGG